MYAAKAAGTNRFAVFTDDMHVHAVARLDRREQLERAIENEELVLHYQPIVDLDLGRVAGFEALVRWQHPTRGLLGPGEFIPLGRGDRADRAARPLGPARGLPPGRAVGGRAVPVASTSPVRQLEQPGFVDEVALALSDGGLDPARLVLEVTESSLVGDVEAERLQALRRLGVRLAIDDFGTGYSSLSYLRRFPMDVLKIDRSFTRDALRGQRAAPGDRGDGRVPRARPGARRASRSPSRPTRCARSAAASARASSSAARSRPRSSSAWPSAPPPD